MRTDALRPIAATLGYAASVLLVAEVGTTTLDTIATLTNSGWQAIVAALAAGLLAAVEATLDIGLLVTVLGPLAFLGMATLLGVVVWPAIVDHVPNTTRASRHADVITLPTRHRPTAYREAA